MKYIVFTYEGNGLALAYHLQQEGHEVIVGQVQNDKGIITSEALQNEEDSYDTKHRLMRYDNMIEKIPADTLISQLKKIPDPQNYFVICESNTLYYYAEKVKKLGFHGQFPTMQNRLFEIDRNLAKDFVLSHYSELLVAEKQPFQRVADAISFLKNTKHVWVLKSQTEAIPTFLPHTENPHVATKHIIENLLIHQEAYENSGFFLEKKIPSVIEITPEKIYYDGVPLGMNLMIENKFIGSGNISFQVGSAGDIVFPLPMQGKIHDIAFPPIVDELAKKHQGLFIWDASLLIDQETDAIYFGEFCPNRLGYNSTFTMFEQLPSMNDFYEKVVRKENPYTIGTIGVSLMLFNLLNDPTTGRPQADLSIQYPSHLAKHYWPYDIYQKNESFYTTGYDMHVSPVTASQQTLTASVETLYHYVSQFSMANMYYRPKFDFLSKEYPSAILNRLQYCVDKKLFQLPFSW